MEENIWKKEYIFYIFAGITFVKLRILRRAIECLRRLTVYDETRETQAW